MQVQDRYDGGKILVAVETDHSGSNLFKEEADQPDQTKWREAIKDEIWKINQREVWTLVDLPPGRKISATRRAYQAKTNAVEETDR